MIGWRLLSMVLVAMLPAPAVVAVDHKPLFASDSVLRLTIAGPVEELARDRTRDDLLVPARLEVLGEAPETLAVTLAPRGRKRRERSTCSFPPIEVRMADRPPETSLFHGQKSLKLVTHCRTTPHFEQLVLLEYAAYRIMNLLAPESFSARLALIDYVDDRGRPITTRHGFFIEDVDDVARRHGRKALKAEGVIAVSRLDPTAAARFALYQDLIGNHDWAMTVGAPGSNCCHNSRPIGRPDATTGLIPVPYDFDYAGLVNAPYAAPPAELRLGSVRERRYRGFCRHHDAAMAEAARVAGMREAVVAMMEGIGPMGPRVRARAIAYLDEQFDRLSSRETIERRLREMCMPDLG